MVAQAFTKEHIESKRPEIQATVNRCLDEMIKGGCKEPVDLVEKFALPVPSESIYSILGVPFEDVEYLNSMNAVRTNGSSTAAAAANANNDLLEYLGKLVDKRTEKPGNDLISKLVVEQLKPRNIDRLDAVQISFLLLVAGNATMVNMIALGVVTLLEHPSQLEDLNRDPSLSKPFVEELCRYHTASALATRRIAKEDITLRGQLIKAGEGFIASNQSSNRDEEVFPDPDKFDLHRKRGSEEALGYGWGEHRCIAEWLARAELEIVFSTLFKKLPNLKLGIPHSEVAYTEPTRDVGITNLPVVW
ncbi:hypothetical protein LTR02_016439 [Friedmanniomyces endolithicus]|nr:hypothetical protein LTR59_015860 [Friedmanniomyces endolithicus]KAK0834142.1 hypothetical protein LTR03_014563 [Friedmanniomyces endolithicus]KAK0888297.1 hypothetical protein LTR02_016439 [Friedmanniomyces endolithicus]